MGFMSEDSYSKPPKFMSEDGKWHFFTAISARPQDRPPNLPPLLNPGGQTEILFDCHLPVSLGGGY